MPAPTTIHESYTIERRYRSAPAKVFAAFADPAVKRRWFVDGASSVGEMEIDFKVGGREVSTFRADPPGLAAMEIRNHTVYLDILPDQRIVFAYSMANHGVPFSASLATIVLEDLDGGTRLTYTEQAAFFDGADGAQMRKDGWTALLERLAAELGEEAAGGGWG